MSEQDIKVKEIDPGWNDPPAFSYESHQPCSRPAKNYSLNKRAVFPISPNTDGQKSDIVSESSHPNSSTSTPPTCPTGPPKDLHSNTPTRSQSASEHNSEVVSVPTLEAVIGNFNDVLQHSFSNEEKELAEVQRRLKIMEKMWLEDKFNVDVKEKLFKISTALKEKRFEDGDSLQRSLMVDYASLCSSWMAAVRKLMYMKKNVS